MTSSKLKSGSNPATGPHSPDGTATVPDIRHGIHLFADGCFEPTARQGGWAFVVYRDCAEFASEFGGVMDCSNNTMELVALLQALRWLDFHALHLPATIWTDSLYAINGCHRWRHIWKNNGWKTIRPNTKIRSRKIADAQLWQEIDLRLSQKADVAIAWCKGHSGIDGNERADELADRGRMSINRLR